MTDARRCEIDFERADERVAGEVVARVAETVWRLLRAGCATMTIRCSDEPEVEGWLRSASFEVEIPNRRRLGPIEVSVGSLTGSARFEHASNVSAAIEALLALPELHTVIAIDDFRVAFDGTEQATGSAGHASRGGLELSPTWEGCEVWATGPPGATDLCDALAAALTDYARLYEVKVRPLGPAEG